MLDKTLKRVGWLLLLVSLLALALAASGCARMTAEDIVAKMQEVVENTDDAHAVVEATVDVQGQSLEAVVEVWEKQPAQARVEVLETGQAELDGMVAVTDGQTFWLYSPAEDQVATGDVGDMPDAAQIIAGGMEAPIQWVLDNSNVELLGEEKIADTKTYKLSLTPKEDAASPWPIVGTATLWVDKKQWIVLKAHFVAPNIGEGTVQVRSFELNPGLDDGLFTFQVPEGAEVIDTQDAEEQHLTLDEAEAQASFDLLTPTYLPNGAVLVDVLKAQEAFVLVYDLDGASFTVAQSQVSLPSEPIGAPETATVRGLPATLIADPVTGGSFLIWQENGVNFAIAGRIDQEEALKIAESLQ